MSIRRGMGKGTGSGYRNILPTDKKVHYDSRMGRKQPQNLSFPQLRNRVGGKPFRLITQNNIEVWQLPLSQYAIKYMSDEKGDKRWRVMEVYVTKDGEIRTRGDLPFKDYDSYSQALNHIEYDAKVDFQFKKKIVGGDDHKYGKLHGQDLKRLNLLNNNLGNLTSEEFRDWKELREIHLGLKNHG